MHTRTHGGSAHAHRARGSRAGGGGGGPKEQTWKHAARMRHASVTAVDKCPQGNKAKLGQPASCETPPWSVVIHCELYTLCFTLIVKKMPVPLV